MKTTSLALLCLISFKMVSGTPSRKTVLLKSAQNCAKEVGINFKTALNYVKGDFSDETREAKVNFWRFLIVTLKKCVLIFQCFLKCVANNMEFWINEKPQKANMLQFVDLLVNKTDGVGANISSTLQPNLTKFNFS